MRHKIFNFIFPLFLFLCVFDVTAYSCNKITILSHPAIQGRGPDSVLRSLMNGLQKNNISYNHNPSDDQIADVVIVLSDIGMLQRAIALKRAGKIKLLLAGPNLMTLPGEYNRIFCSPEIDISIVNSNWTRVAYVEQEPCLADHIIIWPAGVDEIFWNPSRKYTADTHNVLVYQKTESDELCLAVENSLRDFGFNPICLKYGTFAQQDFKKILNDVRFAVFLSYSESQGIALTEAWAMNVPTINWDPQELVAHGRVYLECSSCPYLTPATGLRWKEINEFKTILANIDAYTFSPREWVLQNMTDAISARLLLDKIQELVVGTKGTRSLAPNLVFHRSEETLTRIKEIIVAEQKGAYLRFGDGDVNLALGKSEMLQNSNSCLATEMQEAFSLNGPTILKSLPLMCNEFGGLEPGMFPGNHEWPYDTCLSFIKRVQPLWGAPIEDVYSPVALHYFATYNQNLCINFLKFIRSKCCLFVGNEQVPHHIRELLFGSESQFVGVPSQQSYNEIDRIENECMQVLKSIPEYKVVVIAMGCSGRVLQKRLLKQVDNVFFFDFGSLIDALCGWDTRAWIQLSNFNPSQFLSYMQQEVRVLCTSALLGNNFEARMVEYKKSLQTLLGIGLVPYVVEAIIPNGPTFLNDYTDNVFYSRINDFSLRNKGVNEARSLLAAFEHFNFKDNDIILKLTGRYCLNSDNFIKLIENNCDVDAFVKKDACGQVFTGCFAMRCKYFKEMLIQLDLEKMEQQMINLEREVANYMEQNKQLRVVEVQRLYVSARIGNSSEIHVL